MAIDSSLVAALLPECILVLAAIGIFLGGAWFPSRLGWASAALIALGFAGVFLSSSDAARAPLADGPWFLDPLSTGMRGFSLGLGALFCLLATQSRQYHVFSEMIGCLLLITTGLMLVSGAADLVLMFVGLELISIPTYILLFVGRPGRASDEATAKYFYLSLLSSAIMLYGFATLFGLGGDTRLVAIQAALPEAMSGPFRMFFPVALLMILCGFCFKLAAAPFHFYAPDVYQATTSLNAALLAVVPKVAGVIGLVRILVVAVPHDSTSIWKMVILLSIITMTLANAAALWQTHVRRLMAYSSIAHAGYLLIGLSAALAAQDSTSWGPSAVGAMVFYLVAYAAATVGTFASLAYLSDDDQRFSTLGELAGVGRAHPLIGGFLAVCMFSLSGIPPLAGFLGKFALFRSALEAALPNDGPMNAWFLALSVIGVLNAAVAAAYYLRIVAVLYFDGTSQTREETEVAGNHGAGLAALLSVVAVLFVGLFAGSAMNGAQDAATSSWPIRVRPVSAARQLKAPVIVEDRTPQAESSFHETAQSLSLDATASR